jgi:hypothetical protein
VFWTSAILRLCDSGSTEGEQPDDLSLAKHRHSPIPHLGQSCRKIDGQCGGMMARGRFRILGCSGASGAKSKFPAVPNSYSLLCIVAPECELPVLRASLFTTTIISPPLQQRRATTVLLTTSSLPGRGEVLGSSVLYEPVSSPRSARSGYFFASVDAIAMRTRFVYTLAH